MHIIAPFCEIDGFFLPYERWGPATQCLRETPLLNPVHVPETSIRVR